MIYEFHDFTTGETQSWACYKHIPKVFRSWFNQVQECGGEYIRVGAELYSIIQTRPATLTVTETREIYHEAMAKVAWSADVARDINAVAFDLGMAAFQVTYRLWMGCTKELMKAGVR